jgi:REP element-mobilizing transposase RayT
VPAVPKRKLPRLERHHYAGHAVVFWTLTLEDRSRGWLSQGFHSMFRELMLHVAAREQLFCPVYCLMPDHIHFMWMGLRLTTDQLNAVKFLRTHLEPALGKGRVWQHQAYDHVLREEERRRNTFASVCFYVMENPVRAKLVEFSEQWKFHGAILPGYPDLNPLKERFWETFWKLYVQQREAEPIPTGVPLGPPGKTGE